MEKINLNQNLIAEWIVTRKLLQYYNTKETKTITAKIH